MQSSRIVCFISLAFLLQGCKTPARYVGDGVVYPVPANFTLKGKLDPEQVSIDMSKVYVRRWETLNPPWVDYTYLRFWPDGRCFWGTGVHDELSLDAVESLRVGNPGYFTIEEDNIMIEVFSIDYLGSYVVSRGKLITGDNGNINIRILESRHVGGLARFQIFGTTRRYPNFGSPWLKRSDFYPVDFGPLRAMPTWGGDLVPLTDSAIVDKIDKSK